MKNLLVNKINEKALATVSMLGMLFLMIGELSINVHCIGVVYEPKIPKELLDIN